VDAIKIIPSIVPTLRPYIDGIESRTNNIPSIVPTLRPYVDGIEGRTNYIPTSLPSQAGKIPSLEIQLAYSHSSYPTSWGSKATVRYLVDRIPTIENYAGRVPSSLPSQASNIPTIIPTIAPRVPTALYPTISTIKTVDIPTIISKLDTVQSNQQTLMNEIFDVKLLLALKANETMDELKEHLNTLHSRVQLRPTSSPTLSPTNPTLGPTYDPTYDPTRDPTTDPTRHPTLEPTVPSAAPTADPTRDPTIDPTSDPTMEPTLEPTDSPTKDPSSDPTRDPTSDPIVDPTADPTNEPTMEPTLEPTEIPTKEPSSDPTVDPTAVPIADPTDDPTPAPTTTWIAGLTLGGSNNSYDGEIIDIGSNEFNSLFQASSYHIIQRECSSCADNYRFLYYRRLTNTGSFDAYSYMKSWSTSTGNVLLQDFRIFSTIASALTNDINGLWFGCYSGPPVGAFGHCYRFPNEYKNCQFGLDATGSNFDPDDVCNKPTKFSIFVGEPSYYGVQNPVQNALSNDRVPITENYDVFGDDHDHGFELKGHGNIMIMINAKEFDVVMIFVMFLLLVGLNVIICKYGCCGCGKLPKSKCKAVKLEDSEFKR